MPKTALNRRGFVRAAAGAGALASMSAQASAAAAKTRVAFIGLMNGHCWRPLRNVSGVVMESNQRLGGSASQLEWGDFSGVEFVGVAEPEPLLVQEARKHQPDVYYTSDYRRLVEEKKPQIVWSFVETNRHLEIVEYLAARGIHVIFEKPLATTFEDAKKMRGLAREHGVEVMTNYQMAWWETNQEIKRQADSGAVGSVWRLHGMVGHSGPRAPSSARGKITFDWITDPVRNGGGALMDFGCYNAAWALWFKGRPQSVFAQANYLRREIYQVESNSTIMLTYADGVSILEGSWNFPHSFQDLKVFGMDGSMHMTRAKVELRKGRSGVPETISPTPLSRERSNPILYLLDRIESGTALDNIVALDLNVGVIEILDAAKESIRTGRAVRLT